MLGKTSDKGMLDAEDRPFSSIKQNPIFFNAIFHCMWQHCGLNMIASVDSPFRHGEEYFISSWPMHNCCSSLNMHTSSTHLHIRLCIGSIRISVFVTYQHL